MLVTTHLLTRITPHGSTLVLSTTAAVVRDKVSAKKACMALEGKFAACTYTVQWVYSG